MKSVFSLFVLLFVLGSSLNVYGQNADKIVNLPGAPALNFSMYSGYIKVEERSYFYWFVQSQRSPGDDPLILWLNGGPGCSSLGGPLSENGPFSPDANNKLVLNPYSWNKVANVLYLESPAGVGFSYCDSVFGCGTFDDNKTADDNYNVLRQWFKKYPTFANNPFYIAGESYAGHYIPELVYRIYTNTKTSPNVPPQSNFKGFAAGNPLSDQGYDLDGPYLNQYLQTHGMIPLGSTATTASGNYDPYDILADVCGNNHLINHIRFPHPINGMKGVQPDQPITHKRYVANPPECIDYYVQNYLNLAAVQTAIHAKPASWTDCAGPNYSFSTRSMIPIYKTFLTETNYEILVYSGDADTVLNFIATEKWIQDLGLPVSDSWTAWFYNQGYGPQVGGWTIQYQGAKGRLRFKTIKGAGHMVPWFQPAPAFQLLNDFLGNK